MHQFEHKHPLHSRVYTFVSSKDTEIENYKVTQADRQTHSSDKTAVFFAIHVTLNRMKLT